MLDAAPPCYQLETGYERSGKQISIRSVDWGKYLNWSLRSSNPQMSWQILSQEVCPVMLDLQLVTDASFKRSQKLVLNSESMEQYLDDSLMARTHAGPAI